MKGKTRLEAKRAGHNYPNVVKSKYSTKTRLDLNDLRKRIDDEKKVDKKTNILILSGAVSIAVLVLLFLSF